MITAKQLAELGLEGAQPGEPDRVSLATPDVGQAAGGQTAVAGFLVLLASGFGGGKFLELRLPRAEALGLEVQVLESNPRFMRLVNTESDAELTARAATETAEPFQGHSDVPSTVYVDAERAPLFVVNGPRGLVYFHVEGEQLEAGPILQPIVLQAQHALNSSVMEWCAETHDQWLTETVRQRLERHNPWHSVVAVGLFARLASFNRAQARTSVERTRAGQVDVLLAAPRQWARALPSSGKTTLEALALSEGDRLHVALEDLVVPEDTSGSDWLDICLRRDDLEGVRVLAAEAGVGERLHALLADVDTEGRAALMDVPASTRTAEEQLVRANRLSPWEWWVATASAGRV